MSIDTPEELMAMRRVGALVAETLREMRAAVAPGVTTGQLDAVAAGVFARWGAKSGPQETYDFPGFTCISVNEEVVHGVPGKRVLKDGDLVTLDVTPVLDGFLADAAITVPVGGKARPEAARLLLACDACLQAAVSAAVHGQPLRGIGARTQRTARQQNVTVFPELLGHGIGRKLHEPPSVPNVDWPHLVQPLGNGLVLAVEPMLGLGGPELETRADGWTIATADGSLSAHVEHTIVVQGNQPFVLTA